MRLDIRRRDLAPMLLGAGSLIAAPGQLHASAPSALRSYTQACWVTRNLEQSVADWVALGAGPFYLLDPTIRVERSYRGTIGVDSMKRVAGFFDTTQIELIEPLGDAPSLFSELPITKDEIFHHYQPFCRPTDAVSFDAQYERYSEIGLKVVQSLEFPGLGRNMFFDALDRFGFFIELAERPAEAFAASMRMYETHLKWDGRDPIRPAAASLNQVDGSDAS